MLKKLLNLISFIYIYIKEDINKNDILFTQGDVIALKSGDVYRFGSEQELTKNMNHILNLINSSKKIEDIKDLKFKKIAIINWYYCKYDPEKLINKYYN
jgi:hypothetical protein